MDKNRWSVELGHGLGDLELGAPRSILLKRLQDAGIQFDADDDDLTHLYISEMDLQLTFSDGDPPVLVQIASDNNQVRFGPRPVLDCRLHEITTLLAVDEAETVWRFDDDPDDSLPTSSQMQPSPVSDDDLLRRGTLWIRPLGLGLRLWRGHISEIYLRHPDNAPSLGVGRFTPQQLELSQRKDLPIYLSSSGQTEAVARRWFRFASSATFFALMALVVWKAAAYQRRWQEAPMAKATVIAAGPGGPDTIATEFVVSYRDQNGVEHQASLGLADVYVPKTVGEKVEIRYLPEAPDQPLGPGRVRDVAFVKFFPWAIAVFTGYLVTQVAGVIILRLFIKKPVGSPA